MADLEITTDATVPTGTSLSVLVLEDTDGDGVPENYAEQSIDDGVNSYNISGFDASAGNNIEVIPQKSRTDLTVTSTLNSVDVQLAFIERVSSLYGNGTIDSARQVSKSRSSDVYGSGATIDSTRQFTTPRNSDVGGSGTIDSARLVTKSRNSSLYGGGSIDSTRQVAIPRSSNVFGSGSIDNQIIGFIDTAEVTSHVSPIHSFVENERTSLELIDFDVTYDEADRVWYTPWMPEDKITGNESDIAILSNVAPQGKDPAARIIVQYSEDERDITDESEPIYVDNDELVREITALPTEEGGYYRMKIGEYSGYNDITNINFGFVN